jgi:hypothetical protein
MIGIFLSFGVAPRALDGSTMPSSLNQENRIVFDDCFDIIELWKRSIPIS